MMLQCGHTATATTSDGKPVCPICIGLNGCNHVDARGDNILTGRRAKCSDCGKITDSSTRLPFFRYQPDKEFDTYYCGCFGWD